MDEQKTADAEQARVLEKILQDSDIALQDIPNIDLYMDQIITLFESRVAGNKRKPEDKLLTKTMINNYSKERLLKEIKGKKYSREHILQILLIYYMKQTLSIQDIKTVLTCMNSRKCPEGYASKEEELSDVYSRFLEEKSVLRLETAELCRKMQERESFTELDKLDGTLLQILCLSALSGYAKRLTEELIDSVFGTVPEGNSKKK